MTFEGLGEHVFGDERKAVPEHPFNRPQFQGASVLVTGQNFGCGSSREHAPQALRDWGIGAVVGGSFGEIFFGNCTVLGIPCLTAETGEIEWLLREVEKHPDRPIEVDVERREVRFNGRVYPGRHPGRRPSPARQRRLGLHGHAPRGRRPDRAHRARASVRQRLLIASPAPLCARRPGRALTIPDYFLKRSSKARRMSPGRVESGEESRSTVTRRENIAQSLRAVLSTCRAGMA